MRIVSDGDMKISELILIIFSAIASVLLSIHIIYLIRADIRAQESHDFDKNIQLQYL